MSAALFQIFTLRRRPFLGRVGGPFTFAFHNFQSGSKISS